MVSYNQLACSKTALRPSRLDAAQTQAAVDTPNEINSPDLLESERETWDTTMKLGPGRVTAKNQMPANAARAVNSSIFRWEKTKVIGISKKGRI